MIIFLRNRYAIDYETELSKCHNDTQGDTRGDAQRYAQDDIQDVMQGNAEDDTPSGMFGDLKKLRKSVMSSCKRIHALVLYYFQMADSLKAADRMSQKGVNPD